MTLDLSRITVAEARQRLAQGDWSAAALVEACLAQIDRYEPQIRAWAYVDRDGARARAAELDRQEVRGPLHGIPLGVKDIVDVAGLPTRCGSTLTPDGRAECDAPLVARLRAAGAILLGKTATTAFAYLDPAPTRNPWNVEHTPGGSSSGSAAATAAGMCLAAIGTQTGGSLIRPASYCGLASIKPTYGLIPAERVFPLAPSLDHPGALARTAADLRIVMAALAPEAFGDAASTIDAPRLAWLDDDWFSADGMSVPEAATKRAVFAAFSQLVPRAAEHCVPPPAAFSRVHEMHLRIMSCEAARAHAERGFESRGAYPPKIAELIEQGRRVTPFQEAEARAFHTVFQRAILRHMEGYDALALPSTPAPAPARLGSTGDGSLNYPWSLAGFPVVTIPVGLVEGLPVGLQFVGRPGADAALLDAADWCQARLGFSALPPPLQSPAT